MLRTNKINDLLYNVTTNDIFDHNGSKIVNKKSMWNGDNYLGLMGKNYSLRQNQQLIEKIPVEFKFDHALLDHNGKKMKALFLYDRPMKKEITINGYELKPAIILQNSFDGSTPYKFAGGFLRMVCTNQLENPNSNFIKKISRKHTGDFIEDLELDSQMMVKACENYFQMCNTEWSKTKSVNFLTEKVEKKWLSEKNANSILALSQHKADIKNDKTLWGFYNAITDFSSNHTKSISHMEKINEIANCVFEILN